jgi:hypothetical protein
VGSRIGFARRQRAEASVKPGRNAAATSNGFCDSIKEGERRLFVPRKVSITYKLQRR